MILGGTGFTFFRLHVPFFRSKGAWYIKEMKSKRVVIEFSKYTDKLKLGSDGVETNIDQPYSHTAGGDPVLFVRAGELANFDPFKNVPATRGAEWFSQLLIQNWNAAFNVGRSTIEKKENLDNIMFILLCASVLGILVLIVIDYNTSQVVVKFVEQVQSYKPALDQAIAAAGGSKIV